MKALIGRKVGMTQLIQDNGAAVAVTLIQAAPCKVTQVKTVETDGYNALQIASGFEKRLSKSVAGHLKKSKAKSNIIREFRHSGESEASVGASFNVTDFNQGDKVKVVSTSKGKGFAGTVKRHNFNTGPKTHGSRNYRKPGSIGSMYPQKIFKGKKMSGRMGTDQITLRDRQVSLIDAEKNLIGIIGPVPGPNKSIVTLQGSAE